MSGVNCALTRAYADWLTVCVMSDDNDDVAVTVFFFDPLSSPSNLRSHCCNRLVHETDSESESG